MSYKTTDGLMRHLRENGISISGSAQKNKLRNTGYYHGYKGYRFFQNSQNKIPFSSYKEIYATIEYDTKLKSLFYGKIMFIETALKNIALESILEKANSECLQDIYRTVVSSYNNAPPGTRLNERKKFQQNKLNLQNSIQNNLAKAYKANNPKNNSFL